eukprot:11500954-Alexandrium_andersonii.AAC.1
MCGKRKRCRCTGGAGKSSVEQWRTQHALTQVSKQPEHAPAFNKTQQHTPRVQLASAGTENLALAEALSEMPLDQPLTSG